VATRWLAAVFVVLALAGCSRLGVEAEGSENDVNWGVNLAL